MSETSGPIKSFTALFPQKNSEKKSSAKAKQNPVKKIGAQSDANKHCAFQYYVPSLMGDAANAQINPKKCNNAARRAIIDKLTDYANIATAEELCGANRELVYVQKHVGTSSFMTKVAKSRPRGSSYTYIDFMSKCENLMQYNTQTAGRHFWKLKWLIEHDIEINVENVAKFFTGIWWEDAARNKKERARKKTGSVEYEKFLATYAEDFNATTTIDQFLDKRKVCKEEAGISEDEEHYFLVENLDNALCKLFESGMCLTDIQKMRDEIVDAFIACNEQQTNKKFIVALRKRAPHYRGRSKISLRREWVTSKKKGMPLYVNAFFPEILRCFEKYKSKRTTECPEKDSVCRACCFAFGQEKLHAIQESGDFEGFSENFKKFAMLCVGNPYYIIQSMRIIAEQHGCHVRNIDQFIKDHFQNFWYSGNRQFEEFLETLPLYLPAETQYSDYQSIYEKAVKCYQAMIKDANDKCIVDPMKHILAEFPDVRMANGIITALLDNYAIYEAENQREQNKKRQEQNKVHEEEYTLHDFVAYVHSDDTYFDKEGN